MSPLVLTSYCLKIAAAAAAAPPFDETAEYELVENNKGASALVHKHLSPCTFACFCASSKLYTRISAASGLLPGPPAIS